MCFKISLVLEFVKLFGYMMPDPGNETEKRDIVHVLVDVMSLI